MQGNCRSFEPFSFVEHIASMLADQPAAFEAAAERLLRCG